MGAVARCHRTDDPADWLTVEDAAQLTGLSVRHWRRQAERAFHKPAAGGRSLARKAAPPSGKGKPVWYVHRSIDSRLTRYPKPETREDRERTALLTRYPQHVVERVYRKAHWLRKWRTACERSRLTERELAERIVTEARTVEGDGFAICFRSLQAWRRAYYTPGPTGRIRSIEALIDGRAAPTRMGDGDDGEPCLPSGRDPRAVEYFYGLFHTENKLGVVTCHEMTLSESRAKGWHWSGSYSATRKWLASHDNVSLSFLMRSGKDAWCRRYMPYISLDYSLIEPGQMFQTDHHQCDFWVEHDGTLIRPWLTAVQDMRSRAVVGWNLGNAPHQDAILAAYLRAFCDFAVPEVLRIDNGKDFASELLTGDTTSTRDRLRRLHGSDWQKVVKRDADLVECTDPRFLGVTAELGIETVFAIPYAPWSKGTTERLFGTFEERCGKTFETYCGNAPSNRPECLDAIRQAGDVPTMEDARAGIGEWLIEYHNRPHSADDMAGRSPLQVWSTASRLRRAGDDELLFLMQSRGLYKVGPNGVAFKVGGVRVTYGGGCPALYKHTGRKVFITLDPNDLSHCVAFTASREDRRFIARLDSNKRISPMATVDELRDANKAVGHDRKIMHQAGRGSAGRTRSAVEEMRSKRRKRVATLKATGTDNAAPHATIVPVRTGFEGATKTGRRASEQPTVDRKARDLSAAKAALGHGLKLSTKTPRRRRVSDDLLRGGLGNKTDAVTDDGGNEPEGMDAGAERQDAFSLIARSDRHEREPNE